MPNTTIIELTTAKDYMERAKAILDQAGSVIAEDVQDNINQLREQIKEAA